MEAGQTLYRRRQREAYAKSLALSQKFNALVSGSGDDIDDAAIATFAKEAASHQHMVEADYQQDKSLIYFGKSPQPGPTYFLSHPTAYVLVMHSPSRGGTKGESKYGANHVMIREQSAGGSKDSNDTVTGMHIYLLGAPNSGFKPPAFRTGFDENGFAGATELLPAAASTPRPSTMSSYFPAISSSSSSSSSSSTSSSSSFSSSSSSSSS